MNFNSVRAVDYSAQMTIEKGNIYFTDIKTGKIRHHIDINEGIIYGYARKNQPTPLKTGIRFGKRLRHNTNNLIERFIADTLNYGNNNTCRNLFNNFQFIESVLKIYSNKMEKHLWTQICHQNTSIISADLKKAILTDKNYMNWCFNRNSNPFLVYDTYRREIELKKLCGDDEQLFNGLKTQTIFTNIDDDIANWERLQFTIKVIQNNPIVIYANTDDYLRINYGSICSLIRRYLNMCNDINRKPTTKDFMNEYYRTSYFYRNWKINKDKEAFLKRYSNILKFEHSNLEVILPTDPADLIKEGNGNHNCVGGYIHHVTNGYNIIVFIRHKDNLNEPYITCEINRCGKIKQYLLRYNNKASKIEDIDFHKLYQEHLDQHKDEIKALFQ